MTSSHPAGWIGLSPMGGQAGKFVEFGQWANGDGFKQWEHAFIALGNGLIIEARPHGARVVHETEHAVVHWCENIAARYTTAELLDVADHAKQYAGTPYSFLDYFALAQHRLHIPGPGLKNYIASTKHMICSQLAAQAYLDAGLTIFTGDRWAGEWPGYVTPAMLYDRDCELS